MFQTLYLKVYRLYMAHILVCAVLALVKRILGAVVFILPK